MKVCEAIVAVPVRDAPVFAATLKPTFPFPVPVAPDVMVIHGALLLAVHAQPPPAVTVTIPVLAAAATFASVGEMEYVHGEGTATAACVTVKVCVAIVAVPVRAAPVFAATLKPTDPFPVPVAPDEMVIHGALLAAVQAQPPPAVTATVPVLAEAPTFWLEGSIEYVHPGVGGGGVGGGGDGGGVGGGGVGGGALADA